ncbi:hypothetical protein [Thermogymnomonas acidicola]|uniref:CBS domain-containing protein n=1 Tax=Thermogymnomonas acidicola TaxID=399579 RepID=UPI0014940D57|nr:CBS domain-containing protein [Thermogymnomonas acidicola]
MTVTEKDDVSIAAERIRQLEESEIPVVSSKDGRLVGILRMDEIAANTVLRDKQRMGGKGDYAGVKEKVEISCGSLMDNPRIGIAERHCGQGLRPHGGEQAAHPAGGRWLWPGGWNNRGL